MKLNFAQLEKEPIQLGSKSVKFWDWIFPWDDTSFSLINVINVKKKFSFDLQPNLLPRENMFWARKHFWRIFSPLLILKSICSRERKSIIKPWDIFWWYFSKKIPPICPRERKEGRKESLKHFFFQNSQTEKILDQINTHSENTWSQFCPYALPKPLR